MLKLQEWSTITVQYVRDVQSELRKVSFPSRKDTVASTVVVILAVGAISIYLGIVDFILARILHGLLR